MPVTTYRVANGRVRGQNSGGIRTDYLTDALGSVTATVASSAAVENTYRHRPYGTPGPKTGTGPDPRYLWTGDTGSRATDLAYAEQYNRARHYGSEQGNWTTVDPLWPEEPAYQYVDGNPTTYVDPTGMAGDCDSLNTDLFQKRITAINYGRALFDQIHVQNIAMIIRADDCCKELLRKNIRTSDRAKAEAEYRDAVSYLVRAIFCMICQETKFEARYCFGKHPTPYYGVLGEGVGFWKDFGPDGTTLKDGLNSILPQLVVGIRGFCWEACRGSGGCNCRRPYGDAKGIKASSNKDNPVWPQRHWPYLPGPRARQNPDVFVGCMQAGNRDPFNPPWKPQ